MEKMMDLQSYKNWKQSSFFQIHCASINDITRGKQTTSLKVESSSITHANALIKKNTDEYSRRRECTQEGTKQEDGMFSFLKKKKKKTWASTDFVKLVLELEMLLFVLLLQLNFIAHLQKPYVAVYFLIYRRGIETFKQLMHHGSWRGVEWKHFGYQMVLPLLLMFLDQVQMI